MHTFKGKFTKYQIANVKSGCLESAHRILAYKLFYLFIWWSETTEGFIDSHFEEKDSNVYFVATDLIISLLLGAVLPLKIPRKHSHLMYL